MFQRNLLAIRIVLLLLFGALIAAYLGDQYESVRTMVRFICINCLGLGD